MRESFDGLFSGMALAVVLVYLILVINFQSWVDPLIVLAAVPFTLSGVMWMLFLTQTHLSVPALMGSLMCIGLTSANSILVVRPSPISACMPATTRQYRRDRRGLYASAAGDDDGGRYDSRHDPDGPRRRRGRGAERAFGARGHWRTLVRHRRALR